MKKIFLLRPHSKIEIAPPPLGLLYIASYLREHEPDRYEVKIIDGRNLLWPNNKILTEVAREKPDFIGISSMSADSKEAIDLLTSIKASSKTPVIMGGPYTSTNISEAFARGLDYAVMGEGEITFMDLIRTLHARGNVSNVKGIAFSQDGQMHRTKARDYIEDIDSIPFPAWDLINLDNYFYGSKRAMENPMQIYKKAVPVISSRGCPYKCIYCHEVFGKKFRKRSSDNITDEIQLLITTYGIKEVEFLDDIFNFDKHRAKILCRKLIAENLNIKFCFSNGLRIEFIDDELLDLLAEAGCYRINYGIESGSDRVQTLIKKKLNLKKAKDVIRKTIKKRIMTGAFFMLGFPDETKEEIMATINFALDSPLHTAVFSLVTPYPNTDLYRMAKLSGKDVNKEFETVGKVSLNLSEVNDTDLLALKNYAYRKFYFNMKRMISIFLVSRNKFLLFRNFIEVFQVSFLQKDLYQGTE